MENANAGGSLIFAQPRRPERVAAGIVAAMAVAGVVAVAPHAHMAARPSAGLITIVYSTLMVAAVAIAWMLAALYRLFAAEPLFVLAAMYGYAAVIIGLHIVAFPGAIAAHGAFAGSGTAATLWCIAHVGFIVLVAVYVAAEKIAGRVERTTPDGRRTVRILLGCTLAALGLAVLAAVVTQRSWVITPDSTFTPLFARAITPALAVGYCAVILTVVAVTRLSTTTSLWLTVVLVALECQVWAGGILAGRYYSASWYVGCFEGIVAGGAFFNVIARMVATALSELERNNKVLADRSVRDALTSLLNRRGFDDALNSISRGQGSPACCDVSLLIVDIDRFKAINDRYGHCVGDLVLRDVARAMSQACSRNGDVCYRIGGEEFAVLLAATSAAGASVVAERVRSSVAALPPSWERGAGSSQAITVSVGVASMNVLQYADFTELYRYADSALFEAKNAGRNRGVAFDPSAASALPVAADEHLFSANRGAA